VHSEERVTDYFCQIRPKYVYQVITIAEMMVIWDNNLASIKKKIQIVFLFVANFPSRLSNFFSFGSSSAGLHQFFSKSAIQHLSIIQKEI